MTGKLIAFPLDTSETTSHAESSDERSRAVEYEAPTLARPRPVRASLASELRPLRRARTEREEPSRPRPSAIVPIARTADDGRELSGEIDTARRDPPTIGERIRAESPRGPLRELAASASPAEPEVRHARKPAIRVLVGGRVKYVGWV